MQSFKFYKMHREKNITLQFTICTFLPNIYSYLSNAFLFQSWRLRSKYILFYLYEIFIENNKQKTAVNSEVFLLMQEIFEDNQNLVRSLKIVWRWEITLFKH